MTAAAVLNTDDVQPTRQAMNRGVEPNPETSFLEAADGSPLISHEAVANRVGPARGALVGIVLGAAVWVTLLLVVVPHLTK